MKCVNCGGTEFEKSAQDGLFTTPYSCEFRGFMLTSHRHTVIVPRHFLACLKCGLVHQVLDLEARREGMKELVEFVLENKLIEPDRNDERNFRIERMNVEELSELTNIPRPFLDELVRELLQNHKGYDTRGMLLDFQGDVVPLMQEENGQLWIYGKKG